MGAGLCLPGHFTALAGSLGALSALISLELSIPLSNASAAVLASALPLLAGSLRQLDLSHSYFLSCSRAGKGQEPVRDVVFSTSTVEGLEASVRKGIK